MPGTVEVGEAHAGPPGAEDAVIDPAGDRQAPEGDAATTEGEDAEVLLLPQLQQ